MARRLSPHLVNRELFAQSYGDNYKSYVAVMRSADEAARKKGRQLGVPRATLDRWIAGTNKPKSLEGVQQLEHLLPLTYEHPHFSAVNKLTAWALFSGSIDRSHNFALHHKPEKLEPARQLLQQLGIGSYVRKGGSFLQSSERGAAFGRLLHLLGVPRAERKVSAQLRLPGYVQELVNSLESRELQPRHERLARKHLKDFVEVLLHTRLQERGRHLYVPLPANRNERQARAFGEDVARAIRLTHNPHARVHVRTRRRTGTFEPRVWLPRE